MGVARVIAIVFLVGGILSQTKASAQYTESSETKDVAIGSRVEYNTIVDQMDLSDMRSAMLSVWDHGLAPRNYWTERMESSYQCGGSSSRGLKAEANQNFLQLLQDLSLGSVDPQSVGYDIKLIRKEFITAKQLQVLVLATGTRARALIERMAPQSVPYLSVKEAIKELYPTCIDGRWETITPINSALRYNSRNKVIVDIKKRLRLLGYRISSADDLFDGELLNTISDIQWNLRIKPDGEISPRGKIWGFLNVSCAERVRQMQADMEKMRWFPQYFENRYIFVNLAMSYFVLVDRRPGQEQVMAFRTINGRISRKTPTLRDEIVKVIFNPFWVVPPTIFTYDKVEDLKNLSPAEIAQYFTSHNYEVWNRSFTQKIDPATIDWASISEGRLNPDIYIRQLPHLGNALGVVKFDLTNSFSIYLHDTNQRELFGEAQRQLSSGCVRLEKPFDLAEYLLRETPWNRAAIETVVARPGEIVAKPTEVILPQDGFVPVYLVNLTSQMSSDGVIRFVDDTYGHNAVISQSLPGLL